MRVRTIALLCCLSLCSGCKSWSWSPGEWFSRSAAAPAANTTVAAPATNASPVAGALAETGPDQAMPLGRPISTGPADSAPPDRVQPGRPTVQEPRYLPYSPAGQVPASAGGGATFTAPARDSVTLDVPPTERPAATTTASEVAPRVGNDAGEPASESQLAEKPVEPLTEEASTAKGEQGRWKSAGQGWEAAAPGNKMEESEKSGQTPAQNDATKSKPLETSPRKASQVGEKTTDAAKPTAAKGAAAPRTLPQQPIAIQNRPL